MPNILHLLIALFMLISIQGCISDADSPPEPQDEGSSLIEGVSSLGEVSSESDDARSSGALSSDQGSSSSSWAVEMIDSDDCAPKAGSCGTFVDARDGKQYKYTQIGDYYWMAEDLKYRGAGYTCAYGNEVNCRADGEYYTYEQATQTEYYIFGKEPGVCPAGWYIPSKFAWLNLYEFVDDSGVPRGYIAGALKLVQNNEWGGLQDVDPDDYPNEFGFSAEETGYIVDGESHYWGTATWWSSSTSHNEGERYTPRFWPNTDEFFHESEPEEYALRLRCVLEVDDR